MLKDRVIFFHSVFFCCFESTKFSDLHRCIHKCYNVPFSLAAHSCENRYLEEIEKSGCTFDTCKLVNMGKTDWIFILPQELESFMAAGMKTKWQLSAKTKAFMQCVIIGTTKETVNSLMKELKNPPEEYKDAYDSISKLYDAYISLTNLATDPSGSLQTYSQN